ncbi:ComEC/Rec2 family competence protein [Muriicola marianensis]|uniref:Competence protein ComEC n=1 Tax=Muriicola marianensis TaxID=1324801 RepID=A0ABQ1R3M1_9FLAO|nr:ComEC/Rec2 family competence protein [Muriicola marianensis]GGD53767.1 competence protein ComEC [Muriicola marianensis]
MHPLDFISVRVCLTFVVGIILGWSFPTEPVNIFLPLGLSFTFLLLTFVFENYRQGILFGFALVCTSVCLGFFSISLSQPRFRPDHYSHVLQEDINIWEARVKESLKSSGYYHKYLLEVSSLNGHGASGLILGLEKRKEQPGFKAESRLLFTGKIKPIPPPFNPYQFAYDEYMEVRGVYDQVILKEGNYIVQDPEGYSIRGRAQRIREGVIEALQATSVGREELGVIQAILLGERDDLDPEVYRQYRDAGAAHILAVSGLHIGILLLLIRFFLSPLSSLRHGKTWTALLTISLIWVYSLFTGLSPSVVRAAAMFSFLSYALFLNRPSNTVNILAISALFILVIEPRFLFQVGFQLSYAAVLAIAWIFPVLMRAWYPRNRLLRRLWKLTAVSLAAQLGVMPLCLFYFHQFPGLFLLSALLLVPFLGLIIGIGIPVVILATLNSLPDTIALGYSAVIGRMNDIVGSIAAQETFIFRDIPLDKISLLLLYLLLVFLLINFQKPRFRNLALLGLSVLCLQGWTFYQKQKFAGHQETVLLHRVGNSGILYQEGRDLRLLSPDPEYLKPLAASFGMHRHLTSLSIQDLPRAFSLGMESWIVIDSTARIPKQAKQISGLLLIQSPKVHLGRLLEELRPQIVVADGSNYRQYAERWEQTCREYGVPFYSTAQTGALSLDRF